MYQTSNRRDLWEEWIQWTFYFSMCHDRLNGSSLRLRIPLSRHRLVSLSSASEVQCLSEASQSPQTLSAALSLGLRQSQHGQTQAPVSPQQGLQQGLSGGLWANTEITVGIKECIWQKLDREAELVRREILKIKVAYYRKGEGSPWLPNSYSTRYFFFFALVVTLYWAFSDWTVHYTNVQGKILLLHYTFSKIYTE